MKFKFVSRLQTHVSVFAIHVSSSARPWKAGIKTKTVLSNNNKKKLFKPRSALFSMTTVFTNLLKWLRVNK